MVEIAERTENFTNALDFAFDYAATFIATSGAPEPVMQAELSSIASRLSGVRSLLVINTDGEIRFDAFSHPPPTINLSGRPYFQTALADRGLHYGEVVLGRSSGFPFTPASAFKSVIDGVLVAVIDTRELQKPLSWCPESCGGAILSFKGEIVTVSPDDTQLPQEIIDSVASEPSGSMTVDRGTFSLIAHWQRSRNHEFAVVAFLMVPHQIGDLGETN